MNTSPLRHLPNLLTSLNLICGCMAVVYIFKGEIPLFSILVCASLIFDFLDGFAARALQAYSPMGKELDSLADMVTFGFVPGAIMYHLFVNNAPISLYQHEFWGRAVSFFPFIITVFSALRLAKFNIDTRQTNSFIGVPTPAITIFVVGIALIVNFDSFHITPIIVNSYVIAGMCMVLSFLLVSEIPMFALKFKNFGWSQNKVQYIFLILCVAALASLQFAGIPLVIILYIILSVVNNLINPELKNISNQS